jgi:hypothetical protein
MAGFMYQKYGDGKAVDMSGLQAGLNAQKTNIKDILGNVKELMTNQEAGAIQQNTLNMQSYLKDKIKAGGLNAALTEPVDTLSIKQKFGNMIDLPAVETVANDQTNLLKKTASNTALGEGMQVLKDTGEPLEAHNAFTTKLQALGATPDMIATETPKFLANIATQEADLKTRKLEEQDARSSQLYKGIQSAGPETAPIHIEAIVKTLAPKLQAKERERLAKDADNFLSLSDADKTTIGSYKATVAADSKFRLDKLTNNLSVMENAITAAKQGAPSATAYEQVKKINSTLGGSVAGEIGKQVTNWWESLDPNDDTTRLTNFSNTQIKNGHNSEDVQAALYQAYNEINGNTGRKFQDITSAEHDKISGRAEQLLAGKQAERTLTQDWIKEKIKLAETQADETKNLLDFERSLTRAAQRRKLAMPDSSTIDDTAADAMRFRAHMGSLKDTQEARDAAQAEQLKKANELKSVQELTRKENNRVNPSPTTGAPLGSVASHPKPINAQAMSTHPPLPAPVTNAIHAEAIRQPKLAGTNIDTAHYLKVTADRESEGDVKIKNKRGSAEGLYQFTNDTGAQFGLNRTNRHDPVANSKAAVAYAKVNVNILKDGKVPVTEEDLVLTHQFRYSYPELYHAAEKDLPFNKLSPTLQMQIENNPIKGMQGGLTSKNYLKALKSHVSVLQNKHR